MNLFSISQLQQYSGIKAHTIRIWEQRYNGLTPTRSEGNTRYYDNNQLRRLLNIVSLMDSGYKISQLCSMTDAELFDLLGRQLNDSTRENEKTGYYIMQLIAAGMALDDAGFGKILSTCLKHSGIRKTYIDVIYPMLEKLGLMWTENKLAPSYEHFISNLLKQKFYALIDELPPASSSKNWWVLFLPEDEFHEIGLLFANLLLRINGQKVIYLGANTPFATLKQTVEEVNPSALLLFLVHFDEPEQTQKYLDCLAGVFKNQEIFISGNEKLISQLKPGNNIHWLKTVDDLEANFNLQPV
jgi:MerR family transcriptional regulator, light-induced transcriptional regulator